MLILVGAPWCQPCKALKNTLDKMGQKYAYIDMDVEPETAIHYGVVGVPTLLLIDDETEALIGKLNGAVGQHQIKELLSLANIK